MSRTNVDYLFQITAPADRGSASRSYFGVEGPRFNDHLAQASETPRDVSSKIDVQPAASSSLPDEHQRLRPTPQPAPESQDSSPDDCAACGEPEPPFRESDVDTDERDVRDETADGADAGNAASAATAQEEPQGRGHDGSHEADVELAVVVSGKAIGAEDAAAALDRTDMDAHDTGASDAAAPESDEQASPDGHAPVRTSESPDSHGQRHAGQPTAGALPAESLDSDQASAIADANLHLAVADEASEQVAPDDAQRNAATDDDRIKKSPENNSAARQGGVNEELATAGTATRETAEAGRRGRVETGTLAPAGRRDRDRSKPDKSQRGTGSPADERTEATSATSKEVTVATPIPTPAVGAAATAGEAPEAADKPPVTKSSRGDSMLQSLARVNRAHDPAARSGRSGPADSMPHVDANRFVGRVAKAVQTAHERGGPLQLRLSPPELGSLRLELNVQNGVMTAALETETTTARQVLLDHLPALRERLAEQNIRVERFDVDVRRESSGGQADPRASQHEQPQRQPHHPAPRQTVDGAQRGSDADRREPTPLYPSQTSSGINVLA